MCVEKSLGSSSGKAMPQPEVAALLKPFWEYGQVVSPKTRCDCMLKHKQFSGVKTSVFLNNVHWFFSLTTLHSSRAHECATLKDRALLCGKTFMLENIESWSQPVQSKSIKHMFQKNAALFSMLQNYVYNCINDVFHMYFMMHFNLGLPAAFRHWNRVWHRRCCCRCRSQRLRLHRPRCHGWRSCHKALEALGR